MECNNPHHKYQPAPETSPVCTTSLYLHVWIVLILEEEELLGVIAFPDRGEAVPGFAVLLSFWDPCCCCCGGWAETLISRTMALSSSLVANLQALRNDSTQGLLYHLSDKKNHWRLDASFTVINTEAKYHAGPAPELSCPILILVMFPGTY